MGASKRNQWAEAKVFASTSMTSEDEAEASSKSASSEWEEKALSKKRFFFFWLDLGPPTSGCPNQLVLVGRSPAPHGFFPWKKYL